MHTQLFAQDAATTYLECLDCGEILEAEELERQPRPPTPFDEDLSDAQKTCLASQVAELASHTHQFLW